MVFFARPRTADDWFDLPLPRPARTPLDPRSFTPDRPPQNRFPGWNAIPAYAQVPEERHATPDVWATNFCK